MLLWLNGRKSLQKGSKILQKAFIGFRMKPSTTTTYGRNGRYVHVLVATHCFTSCLPVVNQSLCKNKIVNDGWLCCEWKLTTEAHTCSSLQSGFKPGPCTWIVMTPSLNSLQVLSLSVFRSQGSRFLYWLPWITFPSPNHVWMARQNVLQTACTRNKSKKAANSNTEASAAETVLEKHEKGKQHSYQIILWYILQAGSMFYMLWRHCCQFFTSIWAQSTWKPLTFETRNRLKLQ